MNEIHDFFHQPRALMLSVFIAILLIWVLAWDNSSQKEELRKAPAHIALSHKNRTHQFNYESLISRMNAYYRLVIDDNAKKNVSRKELSDMLFGFHQERRRFYNHLELLSKNKAPKNSERKERALHHYLQSIETIIADLNKRIKQKPKVFTAHS